MNDYQERLENPPNKERTGRSVSLSRRESLHSTRRLTRIFVFILALAASAYAAWFGAELARAPQAQAQTASQIQVVKSDIRHVSGRKLPVELVAEEDQAGNVRLRIPRPTTAFRPGKYKMSVDLLINDKIVSTTHEFTWGVLAINANKSIFTPRETAYLQIAALDELGHTLCDADLKLAITDPVGNTKELLTSDASISKSGTCGPNNVTDKPDYYAYEEFTQLGTYQLRLTNLGNGFEISDSLEVRETVYYAGFTQTAPGDIIATSSGPVTSDQTTMTYRSSVSRIQPAGTYQTTVVYIVTPEF